MQKRSDAGIVPVRCDDEGAEAEDEAPDLPVGLCSKPTYHHELLVGTERIKSQMQADAFQQTCDTLLSLMMSNN